jgi:L-threonylcarbamoyladenylate synthase
VTSVEEAAAIVEAGGLVVVPTETVYGLAGKPVPEVVARIVDVKQRAADRPIQLLVPHISWLDMIAEVSDDGRKVGAAFWPGPLTLVVNALDDAPEAVVSNGTIGIRVPAHPIVLELLARCGPLAATSANLSGQPTPSTIEEIREIFGDLADGYLDGGPADSGLGSTVVDLTTVAPTLVREGPISAEMLRTVLGDGFERV